MTLDEIFNAKINENGDISFTTTGDNPLLDILFLTEYYQHHIDELPRLEDTELNQLFSMFIRDPRYGLGRRDLGRNLMTMTNCSIEQIVKAGRVDDLFYSNVPYNDTLDYLKSEILKGNELVKKWMPRYSSKDLLLARQIAKSWKLNKQQYGHFIKCNTVESKLSRKTYSEIEYDKVPSLASIKYARAFARHDPQGYGKFLEDVKAGKRDLKVSTTTVYDIYKNRDTIDADVFFSKLEKIQGSWIPIVDTSGSMWDNNDSIGKALSVGHYLAKCSTYAPNKVVSFSSEPQLITLGTSAKKINQWWSRSPISDSNKGTYYKEVDSMVTGDCSNTDFGAVMRLLSNLSGNMPEYLVVLSDMEFDCGSCTSKDETMKLFKSKGYNTKIVWWNFNSRNITAPEMDSHGNIYLSGYNPMLLKYLQAGFDGNQFLYVLLGEYLNNISE